MSYPKHRTVLYLLSSKTEALHTLASLESHSPGTDAFVTLVGQINGSEVQGGQVTGPQTHSGRGSAPRGAYH